MSKHNIPAFLLIHGFTGTHYEMDPLADFLNKKNFHVKNIILPGHETTLEDLGIEYERYRLEWVSASEGQKFAETMREFTESVKSLGPSPFKMY